MEGLIRFRGPAAVAAAALLLAGCWESEDGTGTAARRSSAGTMSAHSRIGPAEPQTRESRVWRTEIPADCENDGTASSQTEALGDINKEGGALFDGSRPSQEPGGGTVGAGPGSGRCARSKKLASLPISEPAKITVAESFVPAPAAVAADRAVEGGVPVIKKSGAVDLDEYQQFQNTLYSVVFSSLDKDDWGKKENKGGVATTKPYRLTVHHTAGKRTYDMDESIEKLKDIQHYHMVGRAERGKESFKDIGYHFIIDGMGRIAEGRPTNVLGAHAGGANRGNIGISLMGNLDTAEPTKEQQDSLVRLSAFLATKYDISPNQDGRFDGHYRYGNTGCPGKTVIRRLPEFRRRIEAEKAALIEGGDKRVGRTDYATFRPVNVIES